ncbi:MAG: zf-HC2 domain-containing protein, partial [Candidatus Hydrogenedentes bacterium]|nr:zf-HC2 domain-containing protein [Candidatus Hydrogenedentota bacterium]
MPTCEDIREEFAALLDEELDSETRDTIEAHLSNCSDCLRELHTYKRVADLYRGLPEVAAPEGFERDVLRALQPRNPRLAKLRRAFQGGRGLALAAAVLLVSAVGYFMAQSGFPGMTQKARHMEMASQRRAAN